jgi:DNA-binding MarR family transcriptional regulator
VNVIEFKPGAHGADVVTALISISKQTRAILGLRLAELGLLTGEDDVLFAMRGGEAFSVTQLSASMSIRYPTMLKAVDGLVDRGFLDRVLGPVVRISARGQIAVPEIGAAKSKIARCLSADLGAERLDVILRDLADIGESLSKELAPRL